MSLWRLVLGFAGVTRESVLHHLFQKGRQPRPLTALPVCIQSQISKLHPVQEAGQIKCQACHLPRTNETFLFLPAVLHKDYSSEAAPIRDTSCQLSLVSWLASGTATALDWPQSLVPADAACEEMGDRKGPAIVPSPHIEPPTHNVYQSRRDPETRSRNSSDATPRLHPCLIHMRNAGEGKSSTLFAP